MTIPIELILKSKEIDTSHGRMFFHTINRESLDSYYNSVSDKSQYAVQWLKYDLSSDTKYCPDPQSAERKANWLTGQAKRLNIFAIRIVSPDGNVQRKFSVCGSSECYWEFKNRLIVEDTKKIKLETVELKAQITQSTVNSLCRNVGSIFRLVEISTSDYLTVYLRRYSEDASPLLPFGCHSISGAAQLGKILLELSEDVTELVCNGHRYRILSRTRYVASIEKVEKQVEYSPKSAENIDKSNYANGHLAREMNRWGSFPKHDHYGDESTGEERDYEDYPEYAAHYGE